jgi:hypothetical protein
MSNSNAPKGKKTALRGLVVLGGLAPFRTRIVLESDGQNITAEGQISIERVPNVDRDHDHLLREFFEGHDE